MTDILMIFSVGVGILFFGLYHKFNEKRFCNQINILLINTYFAGVSIKLGVYAHR